MIIVEFLRIASFIEHFRWPLLNFFTSSQKETVFSINRSVMKTFKCSTDTETIFYSVDFLAVIILRYLSIFHINLPLLLLPFIIFIVLLLFSINFEFSFGSNFNTISLFHLNCKISFGFLPIKEKSLDLELGIGL